MTEQGAFATLADLFENHNGSSINGTVLGTVTEQLGTPQGVFTGDNITLVGAGASPRVSVRVPLEVAAPLYFRGFQISMLSGSLDYAVKANGSAARMESMLIIAETSIETCIWAPNVDLLILDNVQVVACDVRVRAGPGLTAIVDGFEGALVEPTFHTALDLSYSTTVVTRGRFLDGRVIVRANSSTPFISITSNYIENTQGPSWPIPLVALIYPELENRASMLVTNNTAVGDPRVGVGTTNPQGYKSINPRLFLYSYPLLDDFRYLRRILATVWRQGFRGAVEISPDNPSAGIRLCGPFCGPDFLLEPALPAFHEATFVVPSFEDNAIKGVVLITPNVFNETVIVSASDDGDVNIDFLDRQGTLTSGVDASIFSSLLQYPTTATAQGWTVTPSNDTTAFSRNFTLAELLGAESAWGQPVVRDVVMQSNNSHVILGPYFTIQTRRADPGHITSGGGGVVEFPTGLGDGYNASAFFGTTLVGQTEQDQWTLGTLVKVGFLGESVTPISFAPRQASAFVTFETTIGSPYLDPNPGDTYEAAIGLIEAIGGTCNASVNYTQLDLPPPTQDADTDCLPGDIVICTQVHGLVVETSSRDIDCTVELRLVPLIYGTLRDDLNYTTLLYVRAVVEDEVTTEGDATVLAEFYSDSNLSVPETQFDESQTVYVEFDVGIAAINDSLGGNVLDPDRLEVTLEFIDLCVLPGDASVDPSTEGCAVAGAFGREVLVQDGEPQSVALNFTDTGDYVYRTSFRAADRLVGPGFVQAVGARLTASVTNPRAFGRDVEEPTSQTVLLAGTFEARCSEGKVQVEDRVVDRAQFYLCDSPPPPPPNGILGGLVLGGVTFVVLIKTLFIQGAEAAKRTGYTGL